VLSAAAIDGLPEIAPGDDLGRLIAGRAELREGDILVLAHKIISKAEGQTRTLNDVRPSERALELAARVNKDPRHVQVILDESREVLRATRRVLICVTHHGFVCANAGVDASNVPGPGRLVLLPKDPDASARRVRARLRDLTGLSPAVLVTDTFGRAWRLGQCDVTIGCAGLEALEDWRGRQDSGGRDLRATVISVADELAAAADLARRKDRGQPAVLVRGGDRYVTSEDGSGARALIRPESEDLFR
jgi:coenzyme F420-0:L-glutamate ligase/coenzyme F420-1:gamma-L-glutamate ligase